MRALLAFAIIMAITSVLAIQVAAEYARQVDGIFGRVNAAIRRATHD